ncbi:hypothetical protein GCM10010174_54650 [Kutzneria viridogrisea]
MANTTRAGAIHTQWCDQDTGESSNPANAVSTTACWDRPVWTKCRTPTQASASTAAQANSQGQVPRSSRATRPRSDWLRGKDNAPMWSVCHNSLVQ